MNALYEIFLDLVAVSVSSFFFLLFLSTTSKGADHEDEHQS